MKLLITLSLFIASQSFAATKTAPQYYANGKKVSLEEAFSASFSGEEITECTPVKLGPNKSGTSLSFKKPKADKKAD